MTRHVFLAVATAFLLTPAAASAQMAGALGKPLPVSSMETGTVTVRVISGSPDKALVGISVELVGADGKKLTARTDGEGRATFNNLSPGSQYRAQATEAADDTAAEEPRQAKSDQFTIPPSGGLRLMISTRPWQGPGGGATPSGPAGAMDPRQMSGIPRGDPAVPAGTMTVAVVRNTVANRLSDHMVHLVGYSADGSVTLQSQKTGADGRATFEHLEPMTRAYYALTTFDRGHGQAVDRVMSDPVTMPPRVGVRLMLAGTPEGTLAPPVEDLAYLARQNNRAKPGEAIAQFWFRNQELAPKTVSLVEIADGKEPSVVAEVPMAPPSPVDLAANFSGSIPDLTVAVGNLTVAVVSAGQQSGPLPGMSVVLEPVVAQPSAAGSAAAAAPGASAAAPAEAPSVQPTPRITDAKGLVTFDRLTLGQSYRVVITVFDQRFTSEPVLIMEDAGQRVQASMTWRFDSSGETRFADLAAGKLYYVQAMYEGRIQRTRPFQAVADRGAIVGLPLYSKPLVSFHFAGWIDDEYMGFQGQFGLLNMSAMPWDPGPAGLAIPLPEGFVGGRVDEEVADLVKVDPGNGLLLRGLISPGRRTFVIGFSLPVSDGRVDLDLDLPLGAFKGSVVLVKTPGMRLLELPPQLPANERQARDGRDIFEIGPINYASGSRMAFKIDGLPEQPAMEQVKRLVVGGIVLSLITWALYHIFSNRQRPLTSRGGRTSANAAQRQRLHKRREDLLEQLVELEAKKRKKGIADDAYKRARGKLRGKLEAVYGDLEKLDEERTRD